jgi:hypothetical protein
MPEQPEKAEKQQAEREQKRRASQIILPLAARRHHVTDAGGSGTEFEVVTNVHAPEQQLPCPSSNQQVVDADRSQYDNAQSNTCTADTSDDNAVTASCTIDDTFHTPVHSVATDLTHVQLRYNYNISI